MFFYNIFSLSSDKTFKHFYSLYSCVNDQIKIHRANDKITSTLIMKQFASLLLLLTIEIMESSFIRKQVIYDEYSIRIRYMYVDKVRAIVADLEKNIFVAFIEHVVVCLASVNALCQQSFFDGFSLLTGNAFLILK